MLIHVDSLYLVVFVDGLSDERHAGVGKVLDFLWCGRVAGSAFVADKAVAGFGEGLFRGGAPLGWFSAELPMYGSCLPFGIQRDEGGIQGCLGPGSSDRARNRKDRSTRSESSQGFGIVAGRQLCRRLLFRLYQPVIPYQLSTRR